MIAARLAACLMLAAAAAPAWAQTQKDSKSPAAPPPAAAPGANPAAAEFDIDTYTCQDVLNDLAAGRQSQIGIAVVVTYAQLRAQMTPHDHTFSMLAIQKVASAAGAACATGDHTRLLRDVVAGQMTTP